MSRRLVLSLLVAVAVLALAAPTASAGPITPFGPITFSGSDYDNTANTVTGSPITLHYNQTTGDFRDIFWSSINNGQPRPGSPDYINQGYAMTLCGISACAGTSGFTALNFSGPAVGGGQSYLTVYDTTPADGTLATENTFDATQTFDLSADVLFANPGHNSSGGVVALYGTGQDGLALLANQGGGNNHDIPSLSLVWQQTGGLTDLSTMNLPATTFDAAEWYRLSMLVTVSGTTWNITGTIQNHVDPADPTSALAAGSPIWTVLYSGSLTSPGNALDLTNPGEVGLMAYANNIGGAGCAPGEATCTDNVGVSITNFSAQQPVPEPASLLLLGSGLLGVGGFYRRKKR